MEDQLAFLTTLTLPLREKIAGHRVYRSLRTLEHLRLFMEHHVFAVWDFMSLVKSLQNSLTCTSVPWLPYGDAVSKRLINEIVLDEESDEDGNGSYLSHFDLYLEGMRQCGADTSAVEEFLARLRRGEDILKAIENCDAPPASREFVAVTWDIISSGSLHRIASAFAVGREEIIPEIFRSMIGNIQVRFPERLSRFAYYLERHIEVDADRHSPMAKRMLVSLCGEDAAKWRESTEAARVALNARIRLWDGVVAGIVSISSPPADPPEGLRNSEHTILNSPDQSLQPIRGDLRPLGLLQACGVDGAGTRG